MRNFKSASAHALLYSSILAGGLLLVNGTTVTKSYAAACTPSGPPATPLNGPNSTTCVNGTSLATLTYVTSNPLYAGGDFSLVLVNHDVTAAAGDGITFAGASGDGFITMAGDSDVTGPADGINALATGNGNDITVTVQDTSSATGNAGDGIEASSTFGNATITVSDSATVTGTGGDGIDVTASRNVTVTTAAGTTVIGTAGDGIDANDATFVGTTSSTVSVSALGTTTGSVHGIDADSADGSVDVTTGANATTGTTGDGIQATASTNVLVTTGTGAVSGGVNGIFASSFTGTTTVTTGTGAVTGNAGDGIFAGSGQNVAVTANGNVTGTGGDGIDATSTFGGNVNVTTAAGTTVSGTAGDGINANATAGGNASVTANGNVNGSVNGIDASAAAGNAAVTVNDNSSTGSNTISGATGHGISATGGTPTGGSATITTTDNSSAGTTITGGIHGMSAVAGAGTATGGAAGITVNDNSTFGNTVITGTMDGISATGGAGATTGGGANVTLNDNSTFGTSITGGVNGISATGGAGAATGGDVNVSVDSTFGATVTGTTGAGILAVGGAGTDGGDVTITNRDVMIQGGTAGIDATTATGSLISINNNTFGTIANLSGNDADLAIRTTGGDTTINNGTFGSTITGRIELSAGTNVMNNGGTWATDGTSDFGTGAGTDTLNNTSSGVITVGNNAGVANVTSFVGLETLNNSGFISMQDQSTGDGSNISDTLSTSGSYAGTNGTLSVDAFLGGPGSVSDVFIVNGNTSGTTFVSVNNTNPGSGAANDGILVVDVVGTASATDFELSGGPIDTGFFVYDLVFNDTDQPNDQFLLVSAPDDEVLETTGAVSGAFEIFRETGAAWETRQTAVRDQFAGGCHVAAVADPPLEGGCAIGNGLWVAGLASWSERDDDILSYDQDIYGIVGGADFGTSLGGGGTLMFGLLAGYVDSDLDFDEGDTSIDYEGATLGAYASWMGGGFFLNVLGKVDLLEMDYAISAGEDNADVTSYGGRADLGYRFGDSMFIEPMVSVDVISTDIDKFEIGATEVDAGSNESFRGGAGLRAGFSGEMVRMSALGRVWEVFENDIEVDVAGIDVSDDGLEGTYLEAAAQVDVDLSTRALLFVRGSVLFSDDVTKPAVHGGFNFTW